MPDRTQISYSHAKEIASQFFNNHLRRNINNLNYKLTEQAKALEPSRITVYERLKRVIRQSFISHNFGLISYGSWNTGLLIPNSDIDLCIQGFDVIDRQGVVRILETIENNLRLFKWVLDIKPIYTANIPVLKIECSAAIAFESFDSGVSNIEELVKKFIGENNDRLNMKIKKDVENKIIKVDVSVENIDFSTNCNVGLRTTEYIQQSLNHYPW